MNDNNDGWVSESAETDEVLFKNEWKSLRRTAGGCTYCHGEKTGGHAIAVLAFRNQTDEILGRWERKTPKNFHLAAN